MSKRRKKMLPGMDSQHGAGCLGCSNWQHLISDIALQIRQAPDLLTILQSTLEKVHQILGCDRLLLCQFNRDGSGQVVAEAVSAPRWSLLHQVLSAPWIAESWLEAGPENQVRAITNVRTAHLPPDYAECLSRLEVNADLSVPLFCGSQVWGLLIAHNCTAPCDWSDAKITGLQQVAVHLSIAIYQADLMAQLQAARADLEAQIAPCTIELPQENQHPSTERAEVTRQQRRDEQFQLAAIVESSQDAVISQTPDGIITSWNGAAEQLFGYTAQEAIGQSVAMLVPLEHRSEAASILERVRQGNRVEPYETKRQCKDGRLVDVSITVSPIRDEYGVVIGVSKIARDISAQHQAKQALQEQTAILSSFYNSSPLMIGVVELSENDIFHVSDNQATATFFHTTVEALEGRWASDLGAPPENIQMWIEHYRASQVKQQPVRFEYAHVTDSDTYWLSVSVAFIGIGEHHRPRFSYAAEDISDRKATELDLKSTKEQLELVLEASSEGFWDWDLITNEIYFSPQWKAMLGYAEHELDNSLDMWESVIFDDDRMAALQLVEDYNNGKVERFEAIQRFHHKDGSIAYILSRAVHLKDAEGKVTRMVGSHLDITENKRQEFALQESEARYRNIIETTTEGVWMLDGENLTSFVNPRMATLLGYDADEMIGRPLLAFMSEKNWLLAQAQLSSRREGVAEQHEFEFQRKDGSSLWVLASASPILDGMGQYAGAIAMMRDISDRKEMEEQLRKSEATLAEAQRMVHLGNWELDVATQEITWSDELFRICGLAPEGAPPTYDQSLHYIHPEDRPRLQESIEHTLAEGTPYGIELRLLRADGVLRHIEAQGNVRRNNEGQIEKLFGTTLDITDRKAAEIALAESRQRFQNLVENSPDIIERFDLQLRHLYISPALTKVTGILPDVFLGKTCRDLGMDETMINAWEAAAATLLETGQKQVIEFETPTMEGVRSFEMAIAPEYSDQDTIESILCLSRDITDRKQAEQALQESEDRFRVLVTHSPVGIYQADAQGQVLYVNPRWLEMSGLSVSDAMGDGWQEAVHPDDRAVVSEEWAQATQEGRPFGLEYRYQKPDGSVIWVSGRAITVFNESGEIYCYFGTVMDITDRRRIEEDLRHQKEMFQAIVDHIPVMIALFNTQGQIDFVNPEFERTLGGSLAEWHHQQPALLSFQTGATDCQDILAHIRSTGRDWKDFTIQTAAQQQLETSWVGVQLSKGRALGIGQDISDRKRKEMALQHAMEAANAANLAKSMFLANMSHELRTPLNVMLGFTQVMFHDPLLTPNQLEDLQTIQRSGDHLLSLINDVLDLSKIEAGHCSLEEEGFDVVALLQGLHTMMSERATSRGLQLIFDIAPGMPQFIIADEQKLRQVLLNLLSNAIKFTQQGHVTLKATWQALHHGDRRRLGAVQSRRQDLKNDLPAPVYTLRFDVIDTGVGIALEEQTSIFKAFVQAEAVRKSTSGTGLGLAISRRLIELMGGQISVCSTPNVGSTFTIVVNVRATHGIVAQANPCDRAILGLKPGQRNYRILVVDDQRENRLLIVRLLNRVGLQVREATNGQEAIQIWQDWRPDLVWIDIRMPGLDGYEVTRQIRSMEQEQPSIIIALTAQSSQGDRSLALTAGCNDYVNKPFREQTIFLKMAEYLGLEYVYAESKGSLSRSSLNRPAVKYDHCKLLDSTIINQLPANWLDQLEIVAECGNDRAVIELTAQLVPELAPLSTYLAELANQFQFEEILSWIHSLPQGV